MLVQLSDGDFARVFRGIEGLKDVLAFEKTYMTLNDYSDDLTCECEDGGDLDIVAVYSPQYEYSLIGLSTLGHKLVWENQEKELTVAQIEKLLGHKVKIVK